MATSRTRGDIESRMLVIIDSVIRIPNIILFIDEIESILSGNVMPLNPDVSSVLKPALVTEGFRCIATTNTKDWNSYFEDSTGLRRRFQSIHIEETSKDDTVEILRYLKKRLEKHHSVKINDNALVAATELSDRFITSRYLPDKAIDLLDEATATKRLKLEEEYHQLVNIKNKLDFIKTKKNKAVKVGKLADASLFKRKQSDIETEVNEIKSAQKKIQNREEFIVDVNTIKALVAEWTGIPVNTINERESGELLGLVKNLKKRIIAQEEGCEAVARAIKRARVGISSRDRPWASLLFLGPTGVGKTELAKVLTKELFGDEERLVQIDMSELMESHSVSKLIGSPPGYVGYREGGQLTEIIKDNPHSVILFDEIEKAHPNVLNILLQVLEDGHLTDAKGNKVDFKNTIIILTSNIGAEEIGKNKILGFDTKNIRKEGKSDKGRSRIGTGGRSDKEIKQAYDVMRSDLIDELKDDLRPELINRLDDIIIFKALTRKDAKKIAKILIRELNERLRDKNIKIKLSRKAINYIVKEGFSEEYGARPLRRVLQDEVEGILADWFLENKREVNEFTESDEVRVLKVDRKEWDLYIKD